MGPNITGSLTSDAISDFLYRRTALEDSEKYFTSVFVTSEKPFLVLVPGLWASNKWISSSTAWFKIIYDGHRYLKFSDFQRKPAATCVVPLNSRYVLRPMRSSHR